MSITIISIDPALRNFGLALATYETETAEWTVKKVHIIQTEKGSDGKVVRKSSDDLARGSKITAELRDFIWEHRPSFAIAEVPTGAQDARAAFSNGVCTGILAGLPVPLIQVSPTEVKMASVGKRTASKAEMIEWAVAAFPNAGWKTRMFKGKVELLAVNEHMADACAAMKAGLRTTQFLQAMVLQRAAMASVKLTRPAPPGAAIRVGLAD